MSAQEKKPATHVNPVGALFKGQAEADAAVEKLVQEGFDRADIEVRAMDSGQAQDGRRVVVVMTDRPVAALEILVNAGGDTHTNQTDNVAELGKA